MDRRLAHAGEVGDPGQHLVERELFGAAKLNRLVGGLTAGKGAGKAGRYVIDEDGPEPGRAIARDRTQPRRGAHGLDHLRDKAVAGAEDQRRPENAIWNPAVAHLFFTPPLGDL